MRLLLCPLFFLATVSNGHRLDEYLTGTVTETLRFFKRIALLPTHPVQDTLRVNNIRKVGMGMQHPLEEIARNQITKEVPQDLGDISRFKETLRPLLVPRVVGSSEHKMVREYIRDFYAKLNWTTEWDSFTASTPLGERDFHNLIVSLPSNSSTFLLLACHYDSKIIPGKMAITATDSAVPCAMLMDLATSITRILLNSGKEIGLKMVFFDGEEAFEKWTDEDSLYGSRHLAAEWQKSAKLKNIEVMILLDLLGAKEPQIPITQNHGAEDLFHVLVRIEEEILKNEWIGKNRKKIFKTTPRGMIEDDHKPFLEKNVPILHLIAAPFPAVWHTVDDNETALDYPTIEQLNAVLRVFLTEYFFNI